jgi:hypothetical protein
MPATTDYPDGTTTAAAPGPAIEQLVGAPAWAPRRARAMARTLHPAVAADPATFHPQLVMELPEPASRWLTRAIKPGAPMARRAAFQMHGEIRLGAHWHEFTANQLLMPAAGFVWAARTHVGHLPVHGYDAYAAGVGLTRWRMLGLPVRADTGADVTLSALDRLAAEATLLPTALVGAVWWAGETPDTAVFANHVIGRHARSRVTVDVAPDGRLRSITMRRWAALGRRHYRLHTFDVRFDAEYETGSIVLPNGIHAAWADAGGEFFRASLDGVTLD